MKSLDRIALGHRAWRVESGHCIATGGGGTGWRQWPKPREISMVACLYINVNARGVELLKRFYTRRAFTNHRRGITTRAITTRVITPENVELDPFSSSGWAPTGVSHRLCSAAPWDTAVDGIVYIKPPPNCIHIHIWTWMWIRIWMRTWIWMPPKGLSHSHSYPHHCRNIRWWRKSSLQNIMT